MAQNLYRRHDTDCPRGVAFTGTYESDENRRAWKKCDCPIYASGTSGGSFQAKEALPTHFMNKMF
jgi:hypothetical protein